MSNHRQHNAKESGIIGNYHWQNSQQGLVQPFRKNVPSSAVIANETYKKIHQNSIFDTEICLRCWWFTIHLDLPLSKENYYGSISIMAKPSLRSWSDILFRILIFFAKRIHCLFIFVLRYRVFNSFHKLYHERRQSGRFKRCLHVLFCAIRRLWPDVAADVNFCVTGCWFFEKWTRGETMRCVKAGSSWEQKAEIAPDPWLGPRH